MDDFQCLFTFAEPIVGEQSLFAIHILAVSRRKRECTEGFSRCFLTNSATIWKYFVISSVILWI